MMDILAERHIRGFRPVVPTFERVFNQFKKVESRIRKSKDTKVPLVHAGTTVSVKEKQPV
jgi:hypothetical protein